MLRRTPLKSKKQTGLKRTPLNRGNKSLKNKGISLKKNMPLKKQSDDAREKWAEARQKCIERDMGRCQVCGKPGTQVHHIHLRSKRRDLLYYLPNLILLCDEHHFHSGSVKYLEQTQLIAASKYITVEQLLEEAESGN